MAHRDDADHLTEGHVGGDDFEVTLQYALQIHQRQYGRILLMREELALLCQAERVDTVGHEDADRGEGGQRHEHQWQEEVVPARELCDEENTRQWGVHHASDQPCHTEQDVVLRGDEDVERTEVVHQIGEDEAREPAHEEGRSEEPATATARVRRYGGEDLEEDGEEEEGEDHPVGVRERLEDTPIEELCVLPVQEDIHRVIPFAIEWREEEDEQGEDSR